MHQVIFNSDDFGYSSGINHAIIDAFKRGILTSTTLMTNTPGFKQAVNMKKKNKNLGVGVHLTLTFGKPLLKNVPSLVDNDGYFLNKSFYLKDDFEIDQKELSREWEAQIQKVYDAGIQPTHLDSHHHMHTLGSNQEVVVDLANKYKLPVRRNFSLNNKVRITEYFEDNFDLVGYPTGEKSLGKMLNSYLDKLLEKLKTYQSSEIMCHMGYIDKCLLESSSFIEPRVYQTDFMIHSDFAKKIQRDEDIQLVHYGEIDF